MRTNDKIGKLVAIMEVVDSDDLIVITTKGVIIRQHVNRISTIGRNTMGVRLIRLDEGDMVSDVARVVSQEEEESAMEKEENREKPEEGENGQLPLKI
jgi:DNA gyrase subunit A